MPDQCPRCKNELTEDCKVHGGWCAKCGGQFCPRCVGMPEKPPPDPNDWHEMYLGIGG
ncbi:MAG: hypothetical protein PHI63_05950 [Patescibacteria group bacterium]|nr:hypothetical protein [Patescibacteria group bacterium]